MKKIVLALTMLLYSCAPAYAAPGVYHNSDIHLGDVPVRAGQQYSVVTDKGYYLTMFIAPLPVALGKTHPWCKSPLAWVSDTGSYNPVAGCVRLGPMGSNVLYIQYFHEQGDFKHPFASDRARKSKITLYVRSAK